MKIVSILGGLGSQMFKYGFFLALRQSCDDSCYIDNSFYGQRDCWNGYELKRIFGINEPAIADVNQLVATLLRDRYYLEACLNAVNDCGVDYYLLGTKTHFSKRERITKKKLDFIKRIAYLKHFLHIRSSYSISDCCNKKTAYFDEYFHNSDEHFREQKSLIKRVYSFPPFSDEKNVQISTNMDEQESVAVHVRRGDHLSDNKALFKRGYYKKAVSFLKKQKKSLVFYVFSDDLTWCKNNLSALGLEGEKAVFVDWNQGAESYRDMQLMTHCKHNIIAISSFGWWGYYLSPRSDKIVISPKKYWLDVKNHF